MRLLQRLNDAVRGRGKVAVARQELSGQMFLSPLCSTYENIFPQVRPLIDALKEVRPYGVGRNGAKLSPLRTPELAILEDPNEEMGWAEFMDLAFAMWLTESELNIHVWMNRRGRVFGYSILPTGSKINLGNGDYYFQTLSADGDTEELSKDEVMTLRYSRNPREIQKGVSPAQTVFVQTQIADLMYQYQRAFLENGAVPAYITIIRASTKEKFEEARRDLERGFKGADKKGKTLYLWRQFLDDGSEKDQVEVKTIQPDNSTLAIKEIMSLVKDDFNKAFGVSEFILGNDSSAKYDNAELSQQQFMLHRVKPALTSFWSQFQHELERVRGGGLGYAVGWNLEIPELTDRMKVKAEISEKNVANLKNLISAGATPGAAVKALGLPGEWLDVAYGLFNEKLSASAIEKTTTAAAQTESTATQETKISDHVCCVHDHTHDAKSDYSPNFTADEVTEKKIYDELTKVLGSAIAEVIGEGIVLSEEDLTKIQEAIIAELIKQADDGADNAATQIQGFVLGATAKEIAGILENGGYHVGEDFTRKMEQRVEDIVINMSFEFKDRAKEILNVRKKEGKTAQQIAKELADIMPQARAELIARNETVYAFRAGGFENTKYMADKYNLKIKKTWRCHEDSRTCEICRSMDGQTVELESAFTDSVEGKDGVTYAWEHTKWNDGGEITCAHPRCRCYMEYEVVNGED